MFNHIVVTNRKLCKENFLTRIESICQVHPGAILLREKDLSEAEYEELFLQVRKICSKYKVCCIVHSFKQVALKYQHPYFHAPIHQLDGSEKDQFISVSASCHSLEEVQLAEKLGCQFVIAGHIFETECKKGLPGRGVAFLNELRKQSQIPVFAIGGINEQTQRYVEDPVCIMSGWMQCKNVKSYSQALKRREDFMKFQSNMLTVYGISQPGANLYNQIEQALQGGVSCIQLREKEMDDAAFIEEAIQIRKLCHAYGVPLIINDRLHVALQSGADGVHVGLDDISVAQARAIVGEDFIIGATAKTVEQATLAQKQGADYLGVGALFASPTKTNAIRISKEELMQIQKSVQIPIVAIGGIQYDNCDIIQGTGVSGIAVVSALFSQKDVKKAAEALKEKVTSLLTQTMPTALTIAGSDSSGGAGIQADIKTMTMNGVFAMSAITALTAQNTTGVSSIMEVTPEFLEQQIDAVYEDIPVDAVKIGMVSSSVLIEAIAKKLKEWKAQNIVVDPVMVATSKARLISVDAIEILKKELLPLATVITPNIPEAEVLADMEIQSSEDMKEAAKRIYEAYGCAVLVKGGHQLNDANDLLYTKEGPVWFYGERIQNMNTHGTGCTLSSAIASNLAKGYSLGDAVKLAKEYISQALKAMLDLGKGSGPLMHNFDLTGKFK